MQIGFESNGETTTKIDDLTASLQTLGLTAANGERGIDRLKENDSLKENDGKNDKANGSDGNKANEKANESVNDEFDSRISLPFPRFVDEIDSKSCCDCDSDDKKEEDSVAVAHLIKDIDASEEKARDTDTIEPSDEKEAPIAQGPEEKEHVVEPENDDLAQDQTANGAVGLSVDVDAGDEDERERFVVRLRGLPWSAREPEIRAFFSEEEVVEVQIVFLTDGRASGEALVEFTSDSSLVTAFLKNRQHIGHRYIEIFKSTPIELDTAAGRCSRPPAQPPKSQFVIRMRGLPYSAMETDVEVFFGGEPTPSSIHLIKDDLGRPSGEGFVEFVCEVDAIAAMAKHRHHMGHRYIELFRSSPEELMRALGLTAGFLKQLGGAGLKSACVLMRGLPYSCTESDITKFFQEIEVTPIRIHRKADGAEAYVEFYSVADTDKAMTRHRNYIGRRYIELFRVSYEDMARTVGLPLDMASLADGLVDGSPATNMVTPHPPSQQAMSHLSMRHGGPPHLSMQHRGHAHPVPQAMQHPRGPMQHVSSHGQHPMQGMAGPMQNMNMHNMVMPSPYAYSLLSATNRSAMQPNGMGNGMSNGMGGPVGMGNGMAQGVRGLNANMSMHNGMGPMANMSGAPFGPPAMHPMAGPTTPNGMPPPAGPSAYYRTGPGPQYYQ